MLLGVYVRPSAPTLTRKGDEVAVTAAGAVTTVVTPSTAATATATIPTIVFEKSMVNR